MFTQGYESDWVSVLYLLFMG